jgi:HAD superfamily phosphoserine phosphatase-like hydrolase
VLMSASVDFYIPEFARQLGFDQVISTEVRWHGDRLDGTLISANRRGEEKARCLRELLATRDDTETFAYGNSDSDLPHLQLVKHGLLVNGSLAARRRAAELGVACADWT